MPAPRRSLPSHQQQTAAEQLSAVLFPVCVPGATLAPSTLQWGSTVAAAVAAATAAAAAAAAAQL